MYKIRIAEAAELDFKEARSWYKKQASKIAKVFENNFKEAIQYIAKSPLKIQIRYDNTRIYFIKRFPYGIHFYLEENVVTVVAVFHVSRDPEKWSKRGETS